ncbi:MAG: hypothetical protein EYC70_08465 [Planctomycetota bacterium]|nr:MAG: hypothetical protein EYC70_08465 [Planctomycetota bacterium]
MRLTNHSFCFLSAVGLGVMLSCGSATQELSCIHPPVLKTNSEVTVAVDIAGRLESLLAVSKDRLVPEFQQLVTQDFARLSDENASLLLFLNAIDCYMQRGAVGLDLSNRMADIVRTRWAVALNLGSPGSHLTATEVEIIRRSPQSELILARLRECGILH